MTGCSKRSPVRPSNRNDLPLSGNARFLEALAELLLGGPVEDRRDGLEAELCAAQPRWVSRIWPTFMRLGTPSGLSRMSTGVPSARYGMSSSGRILEMTPLLPCRPAILSPTEIMPLGGDVNLDHLLHAAGQFVAALQRVRACGSLLVDAGQRQPFAVLVVDLLRPACCLLRTAQVERCRA